MTAVLAAIIAGVFAGAVALFRERQITLTKLLVAARVLQAEMANAADGLDTLARWDHPELARVLGLVGLADERQDPVSLAWEQHREVLAGQLREAQWRHVERAVRDVWLMQRMAASPRDLSGDRAIILSVAHDLLAAAVTLGRYSRWCGVLVNFGRFNRDPLVPSSVDLSPDEIESGWELRMTPEDREEWQSRQALKG